MKFKIKNNQAELHILVKPNARKTEIISIDEKEIIIAVHAKPIKGEANKELIAYLSKVLKTPKSQVILKKGEGSRYKTVFVPLKSLGHLTGDEKLLPGQKSSI